MKQLISEYVNNLRTRTKEIKNRNEKSNGLKERYSLVNDLNKPIDILKSK